MFDSPIHLDYLLPFSILCSNFLAFLLYALSIRTFLLHTIMSELQENHDLGRSCSNEHQEDNPEWDAACLKYFQSEYQQ